MKIVKTSENYQPFPLLYILPDATATVSRMTGLTMVRILTMYDNRYSHSDVENNRIAQTIQGHQ